MTAPAERRVGDRERQHRRDQPRRDRPCRRQLGQGARGRRRPRLLRCRHGRGGRAFRCVGRRRFRAFSRGGRLRHLGRRRRALLGLPLRRARSGRFRRFGSAGRRCGRPWSRFARRMRRNRGADPRQDGGRERGAQRCRAGLRAHRGRRAGLGLGSDRQDGGGRRRHDGGLLCDLGRRRCGPCVLPWRYAGRDRRRRAGHAPKHRVERGSRLARPARRRGWRLVRDHIGSELRCLTAARPRPEQHGARAGRHHNGSRLRHQDQFAFGEAAPAGPALAFAVLARRVPCCMVAICRSEHEE